MQTRKYSWGIIVGSLQGQLSLKIALKVQWDWSKLDRQLSLKTALKP